ncbi:hypothetical protein LTS18_009177, partial [Coniosporium uncinatum]
IGILLENLVAVQIEEGGGGILARDLLEHDIPARVRVEEVGQVIDLMVDNAPEIVRRVVFADLGPGEGCVGHGGSDGGSTD